jgi:hypothetical protein
MVYVELGYMLSKVVCPEKRTQVPVEVSQAAHDER